MDGEDELKKQEMNLHNLSEKYEKGIQNLKQSLERLRESEIKKEFDDKLLKLKESLNKIHDIVDTIKSKTDEWVN
ncbi:hypothetical protein P3W45_001444 [Vairimorpha bombi]